MRHCDAMKSEDDSDEGVVSELGRRTRETNDQTATGCYSKKHRLNSRRDGALCALECVPLANQIPTDPEPREVFPKTVGVIRAGFLLSGVGEKRAARIGERTTG